MNLTRESFYTLLFQISGFICATIAGIIVARALGPENRGLLSMALLYPFFFLSIFNPSINVAIIYHMGKKKFNTSIFAGNAFILGFVLSLLSLIFFFITYAHFRESFYRGIELKYLLLSISSVPFYFMLGYSSSILQGSMLIRQYNLSNQLQQYCNLIFILIFIAFWNLTLTGAILAGISGIVLGGIYAVVKVLKSTEGLSFDKTLALGLVKDGGKLYIGSISTFIVSQSNIFILNYYRTPAEVGYFAIAFAIANVLSFFLTSLTVGLYPKVAHATIDETINLVQVACRQLLLITAIAAFFTAVFSKYIVLLYGGKLFLPSVKPLLLLLPGITISVVPGILNNLWLRKGWFTQITYMAVFNSLVSLLLNLILIPRFGVTGAAFATTVTYSISSLMAIVLFSRYGGRDISKLFIPQKEDLGMYTEILVRFRQR